MIFSPFRSLRRRIEPAVNSHFGRTGLDRFYLGLILNLTSFSVFGDQKIASKFVDVILSSVIRHRIILLTRDIYMCAGWSFHLPARAHPATASAHPATASAHPATASSHPATASSHPATASAHPATALLNVRHTHMPDVHLYLPDVHFDCRMIVFFAGC